MRRSDSSAGSRSRGAVFRPNSSAILAAGAAPIHNAVAAGHADVTQILAPYNTDYDAQAHVLAWGLRRHARRCRRKKLAVDAVEEAARNDELWPSRLTMERAATRRSRPSAEAEAP